MKNRRLICTFLALVMAISSLVYVPFESYAEDQIKISKPYYDAEQDYAVWDCIYFGSFPQDVPDMNEKQPVKWRVLSIDENNNALIITDKCVVRSRTGYFWSVSFTEEEQKLFTTVGLKLKDVCNPAYGFCSDTKASDTRKAEITRFALEYNERITEEHGEEDLLPYERYDIVKFWAISESVAYTYYNASMCVSSEAGSVNTKGMHFMNDNMDEPTKVMLSRPVIQINLGEVDIWTYAGNVDSKGNTDVDRASLPTPSPGPSSVPVIQDAIVTGSDNLSAKSPEKANVGKTAPEEKTIDSFTTKNLKFKVLPDKKTVSVLGFDGKAKKSTLKIPDKVSYKGTTYKVTEIVKNAFRGNRSIKKLIIGKNITKIGDNAFTNCKKLKSVKIKSRKLKSIPKRLRKLMR